MKTQSLISFVTLALFASSALANPVPVPGSIGYKESFRAKRATNEEMQYNQLQYRQAQAPPPDVAGTAQSELSSVKGALQGAAAGGANPVVGLMGNVRRGVGASGSSVNKLLTTSEDVAPNFGGYTAGIPDKATDTITSEAPALQDMDTDKFVQPGAYGTPVATPLGSTKSPVHIPMRVGVDDGQDGNASVSKSLMDSIRSIFGGGSTGETDMTGTPSSSSAPSLDDANSIQQATEPFGIDDSSISSDPTALGGDVETLSDSTSEFQTDPAQTATGALRSKHITNPLNGSIDAPFIPNSNIAPETVKNDLDRLANNKAAHDSNTGILKSDNPIVSGVESTGATDDEAKAGIQKVTSEGLEGKKALGSLSPVTGGSSNFLGGDGSGSSDTGGFLSIVNSLFGSKGHDSASSPSLSSPLTGGPKGGLPGLPNIGSLLDVHSGLVPELPSDTSSGSSNPSLPSGLNGVNNPGGASDGLTGGGITSLFGNIFGGGITHGLSSSSSSTSSTPFIPHGTPAQPETVDNGSNSDNDNTVNAGVGVGKVPTNLPTLGNGPNIIPSMGSSGVSSSPSNGNGGPIIPPASGPLPGLGSSGSHNSIPGLGGSSTGLGSPGSNSIPGLGGSSPGLGSSGSHNSIPGLSGSSPGLGSPGSNSIPGLDGSFPGIGSSGSHNSIPGLGGSSPGLGSSGSHNSIPGLGGSSPGLGSPGSNSIPGLDGIGSSGSHNSIPGLGSSSPSLPGLGGSVPTPPTIPTIPNVPTIPTVPNVPTVPTIPAIPNIPTIPNAPAIPNIPTIPSVSNGPTIPSLGNVPGPSNGVNVSVGKDGDSSNFDSNSHGSSSESASKSNSMTSTSGPAPTESPTFVAPDGLHFGPGPVIISKPSSGSMSGGHEGPSSSNPTPTSTSKPTNTSTSKPTNTSPPNPTTPTPSKPSTSPTGPVAFPYPSNYPGGSPYSYGFPYYQYIDGKGWVAPDGTILPIGSFPPGFTMGTGPSFTAPNGVTYQFVPGTGIVGSDGMVLPLKDLTGQGSPFTASNGIIYQYIPGKGLMGSDGNTIPFQYVNGQGWILSGAPGGSVSPVGSFPTGFTMGNGPSFTAPNGVTYQFVPGTGIVGSDGMVLPLQYLTGQVSPFPASNGVTYQYVPGKGLMGSDGNMIPFQYMNGQGWVSGGGNIGYGSNNYFYGPNSGSYLPNTVPLSVTNGAGAPSSSTGGGEVSHIWRRDDHIVQFDGAGADNKVVDSCVESALEATHVKQARWFKDLPVNDAMTAEPVPHALTAAEDAVAYPLNMRGESDDGNANGAANGNGDNARQNGNNNANNGNGERNGNNEHGNANAALANNGNNANEENQGAQNGNGANNNGNGEQNAALGNNGNGQHNGANGNVRAHANQGGAGGVDRYNYEMTDLQALNYLLTLEEFETAFYEQALQRFSQEDFTNLGYPRWVRPRYEQILSHERVHKEFLQSAITSAGQNYVEPCNYELSNVNDPRNFVEYSEAVQSIVTSAYVGILRYFNERSYITAGASILAVEARQAAWINSAVRHKNPWNSAFETALTPSQVYTLLSSFFDFNSLTEENRALLPIAISPAPRLSLAPRLIPGQQGELSFPYPTLNEHECLYVVFLTGAANIVAPLVDQHNGHYFVEIPLELEGAGTVYIVLIRGSDNIGDVVVSDQTTVAGPAIAEFPYNAEGRRGNW